MHYRRLGIVVFALVSSAVHLPPIDAQARRGPQVNGEILIKYRPGTSDAAHARARGRANAQLKRRNQLARGTAEESFLDVVAVTDSSALSALRADPAVEHAEPNLRYQHFAAPNDPLFSEQWGLNNIGQVIAGAAAGAVDADTDALEAWSSGIGSPQVYVAVVDQGIHIAHEDLGVQPNGPIWTNPYERSDGVDNDGNGYVDDVNGFDFWTNDNTVYDGSPLEPWTDAHGTHVAGTIGARTNNGVGVAGVNWDVRIIPAKFMGPDGGTTDGAIRAIDYIIDLKTRHGLNIVAINASWGSAGFSQLLLETIARAAREDILLIAAAGNGGADDLGDSTDQFPEYPASYDTTALAGYDAVIAVAATGYRDELAPFSNYGERSVDLGAPGVSIISTYPQHGYGYSNGTSVATPHVTGAAALVSAAAGITGRALRARLLASADRTVALQGRTTTGGRLNVRAALSGIGSTAPPPLPSPWESRDVGAVGAAGSAGESGGTYSVSGAGADVWGTADAFQFTYRTLTGDGSITARVASVQNVAAWTKAGVMIRSSLSPGAAHAFALVSSGKGVAFQRRPSDGASSLHTAGAFTAAPQWVRLTRTGSTVTAFESADGASWRTIGSSTIALGSSALVGLAVSSHVAGTPADATFDSVAVRASTAAAWTNGDIGAVGVAGNATVDGASIVVTGSGADIWGASDQFHYAYQPLAGDGSIVARVASIQNSHVWVKAGVMIRETLASSSPQAMMLVTPGGTKGLAFQRRVSAGGISTSTSAGAGTAPAWVKLTRSGSTISAFRSADGLNWTFVGADTFAMGSVVYVGVAVTSHDNTVLATARFEQVAITR